jgi:hypothetical protein
LHGLDPSELLDSAEVPLLVRRFYAAGSRPLVETVHEQFSECR